MAFKEIVTKAVIGKGKKHFLNSYTLTPEVKPSTILGCWVINHKFDGYKSGEKIGVDGNYDINIWYSYDNDSKTAVASKTIDYTELFSVKVKENADINSNNEIIVRSLKQPNCVKVNILDDGVISFDIEKELGIEIVGEEKVKINIEDEEEPWDIIEDEVESDIDNIDQDYIKNTI